MIPKGGGGQRQKQVLKQQFSVNICQVFTSIFIFITGVVTVAIVVISVVVVVDVLCCVFFRKIYL